VIRRVAALAVWCGALLPVYFGVMAVLYGGPPLLLLFFPILIISAILVRGGMALWN
jgi:hypothetical protein